MVKSTYGSLEIHPRKSYKTATAIAKKAFIMQTEMNENGDYEFGV